MVETLEQNPADQYDPQFDESLQLMGVIMEIEDAKRDFHLMIEMGTPSMLAGKVLEDQIFNALQRYHVIPPFTS